MKMEKSDFGKTERYEKKTIILLWLVTAYSCSNYSSRLKAVLDYSGTNRAELEKVLDHYSQDPADSLKLKASIFLIENMPGHYTFGGPYMKSYNEQLGLLKNCPYYEKKSSKWSPSIISAIGNNWIYKKMSNT